MLRAATCLKLVVLSLSLSASASAGLTIDYAQTYASVNIYDSSVPVVNNFFADAYSLSGDSVTATEQQYTSTTNSTLSASGMGVQFTFSGGGDENDFLTGYSVTNFTAQSDLPYSFDGVFSSTGSYTEFQAMLYDYGTGTYLFRSIQSSNGPVTLSLGLQQGNLSNVLEGSPSGMIQAGHVYLWQIFARTDPSADTAESFASGGGVMRLAAVPEPSSFLSLAAGLVALGLARRRLRRD